MIYRGFGTSESENLNYIVWDAALTLDNTMPVQHAQGSGYQKDRGSAGHDMRLFTIHQTYRDVSYLSMLELYVPFTVIARSLVSTPSSLNIGMLGSLLRNRLRQSRRPSTVSLKCRDPDELY